MNKKQYQIDTKLETITQMFLLQLGLNEGGYAVDEATKFLKLIGEITELTQ